MPRYKPYRYQKKNHKANRKREQDWARQGIKDASVDLYNELLLAQKGVCAICFHPPKNRRLALDHNHKTGKVRGLLCFKCNYNLPKFEWFNQTPQRLHRAVEYVKQPQKEQDQLVEKDSSS